MKERLLTLVSTLSVSIILLALVVPVNASSLPPAQPGFVLLTDGVPLPPPGPRPTSPYRLTDGVPLPPPGPRPTSPYRLTDGVPLPPPGPRPTSPYHLPSQGTPSSSASSGAVLN
jgi:hypothetical protein